MTLLLHAIGEPPDVTTITDRGLVFIESDAIGVWASRDPGLEPLGHHQLVEAICDRQHCLPLRFGTRVADDDAARALIGGAQARLLPLLRRVGGRREIALTLLWSSGRAGPDTRARDPGGRAYLEARRAHHLALDERLRHAERLAATVDAALADDPADRRHALCPAADVALSTAILAPLGGAEALKERVLTIAGGLPEVRAVVSGPWPPYTFAGQE